MENPLKESLMEQTTMLSDVCEVLGYRRFVDEEDKTSLKKLIEKVGLTDDPSFFKAPFAKDFRRLVCNIILPSIRKYGS